MLICDVNDVDILFKDEVLLLIFVFAVVKPDCKELILFLLTELSDSNVVNLFLFCVLSPCKLEMLALLVFICPSSVN